jgi:Family of unknown function (DUF6114)
LTAADSTSAPADNAKHLRQARLFFREWRRTRPFWGGLLITLGGVEILSTTVLSLGPTFRVGLGGVNAFLGTVIAFVLTLCGLLLWFSPAQRVFYSIVAVVLALATFNTINYGGFFIGMLLGIIGGAMAFAWSHAAGRTRPRRAEPAGAESAQTRSERGNRLLSIAAVPMTLSMLLAPAVHVNAPQGCILFILCTPPTPTPTPAPTPTGKPSPPSPGKPGKPGTPGKPGKPGKPSKPGKIKRTRAQDGLVASTVPTVLSAGSAQLVGLGYDGVAEVPRSSGPPLPMMKFTLRSVTLTGNPTLTISENGSVAATSTSRLSFSGNVVLYATKLSGDLLGIPVTITASSPLSLVLQLLRPLTQGLTVTMTHVVTDQPVTTAATSQWDSFLISVRT